MANINGQITVISISDQTGTAAPSAGANGSLGRLALDTKFNDYALISLVQSVSADLNYYIQSLTENTSSQSAQISGNFSSLVSYIDSVSASLDTRIATIESSYISGTSAISGEYNHVAINSQGLVISGSNLNYAISTAPISGEYKTVLVDSQGLVISGSGFKYDVVTISGGANLTPSFSNDVYDFTLDQNLNVNYPTNTINGKELKIRIRQNNGNNFNCLFDSAYKWESTAPVISAAPNSSTIINVLNINSILFSSYKTYSGT